MGKPSFKAFVLGYYGANFWPSFLFVNTKVRFFNSSIDHFWYKILKNVISAFEYSIKQGMLNYDNLSRKLLISTWKQTSFIIF